MRGYLFIIDVTFLLGFLLVFDFWICLECLLVNIFFV